MFMVHDGGVYVEHDACVLVAVWEIDTVVGGERWWLRQLWSCAELGLLYYQYRGLLVVYKHRNLMPAGDGADAACVERHDIECPVGVHMQRGANIYSRLCGAWPVLPLAVLLVSPVYSSARLRCLAHCGFCAARVRVLGSAPAARAGCSLEVVNGSVV